MRLSPTFFNKLDSSLSKLPSLKAARQDILGNESFDSLLYVDYGMPRHLELSLLIIENVRASPGSNELATKGNLALNDKQESEEAAR